MGQGSGHVGEWVGGCTNLRRFIGALEQLEECYTLDEEHPCLGALLVDDISLELDMCLLLRDLFTCVGLLESFMLLVVD